jgi:hypothetical protein
MKNLSEPIAFAPNLVRALFGAGDFVDLAVTDSSQEKFDVIIPVLHSNDLWEENLRSYFREIPINKLLIGDAGCIDNTIKIAKTFPRVEIIDHSNIRTLGKSIADLVSRVTTEHFIYLQSDVFIPRGWTEIIKPNLKISDWVSTPQQVVVMIDYLLDYNGQRPISGAQIGKREIFRDLDSFIEDDFVYRNEEYVLANFVKVQGGIISQSNEAFHFHQVMRRITTGMEMSVTGISIDLDEKKQELERVNKTQLFGLIKYCDVRDSSSRQAAESALYLLLKSSLNNFGKAIAFSQLTNPEWKNFICRATLKYIIFAIYRVPKKILKLG